MSICSLDSLVVYNLNVLMLFHRNFTEYMSTNIMEFFLHFTDSAKIWWNRWLKIR